ASLVIGHPATVDAAALIPLELEMNPGNGGHRPRCAKQMHLTMAKRAMLCGESAHKSGNLGHHGGIDIPRDQVSPMPLGKGDDAHRKRYPGFDLGRGRTSVTRQRAIKPDQLRGAAADV